MRRAISFVVIAGGIFLALAAQASVNQYIAPDALVKAVTDKVIADIRNTGGAGDSAKIAALVETTILPHFDFSRMTRLAMGRNWRLASPAQQQALTAEFKTLLVHTYSASLAQYRNQQIEVDPLHVAPGDTAVTVRSSVQKPGTEPVQINYDLAKEPAGWKVYNVRVDGMSLVITYRDTFANQVRDSGIDGLIKALTAKNASNDARARQNGT
jgi:phospholipid transport system substrate-binding protein